MHLKHRFQPYISTRCVCETLILPAATKSKSGKISKAYLLTMLNPKGHVMSVKCEQPLGELSYCPCLTILSPPKLQILHFYVGGTEYRQKDRQIDKQTDRQSDH